MLEAELYDAAAKCFEQLDLDLSRSSAGVAEILELIQANVFEPGYIGEDLERGLGAQAKSRLSDFAAEMKKPAGVYMTDIRMKTGAGLLALTDISIGKIAELLGYLDTAAFRNGFERTYGVWPGEFRREAAREVQVVQSAVQRAPLLPPAERRRKMVIVARRVWRMVKALPFAMQLDKLRRGAVVFSTPEFFELLSRQSRELGVSDPRRSQALAELALASVEASAAVLGRRYAALHELARRQLSEARRRLAIWEDSL